MRNWQNSGENDSGRNAAQRRILVDVSGKPVIQVSLETIYYGGQNVLLAGTHDTDLNVLMLRKGERRYNSAINARKALGEKWKEIGAKDVNTCTG